MGAFDAETDEEQEMEALERLRVDLQCQIYGWMDAKMITYTELAKRMGVSESSVHRLFRQEAGFTLKTVTRVARALGLEPVVTFRRPRP